MAGSQAPDILPSGTMINPREHNNVNVVVTISGKSAENPENKQVEEDELLEVDLEIRDHEKTQEEVVVLPVVEEEKQTDPKPTIRLTYPQQTKKKKKMRKFSRKSWRYSRNSRLTFRSLKPWRKCPYTPNS